MFAIDIRTIYLGYIIISIINVMLMGALYFQIKKRYPGILWVFISFLMAAVGVMLIFLRDSIPDIFSIPIGNTFVISSIVVLLIGFERFVDKRGPQFQNYLLIIAYFLVHTYFAFFEPDLNLRNINSSLAFMIISMQIAYLMLKRTPKAKRKNTRLLGILFCTVFIIQLSRIIYILSHYQDLQSHFDSSTSESIFLLTWEFVLVILAYSVFLMYNKQLINDVNAQEEKFSKAFHAAPFVIMLSNFSNGEIFEVNQGVKAIAGYEPEELIGSDTINLKLWKNNEDRKKFTKELIINGQVVEEEFEFRKKSGETFTGLISAEIIYVNNKQSIISVISDINKRKIMELNLRQSETRLKELNISKDKFFSIIAHDLRSPFNSILGFSELLNNEVKSENYEGVDMYSEIINKSSQHAMELLSNLMEWSSSQTGRIVYNPKNINITRLIESVTELMNSFAKQKSITINHKMPSELMVYADKAMLGVVLRNLISNAIKFSFNNDEILIEVEEKEKKIIVSVIDYGVGIEDANFNKIFRVDKSFSTSGTNNEKGTGLGLVLCNDFIQKHNGEIWLNSEIGKGSQFYFSIPKV